MDREREDLQLVHIEATSMKDNSSIGNFMDKGLIHGVTVLYMKESLLMEFLMAMVDVHMQELSKVISLKATF